MTGYAAASAESPRGRLSLELRTVNARFLDLQFRVAEELRALEPLLREAIAARVSRGKVDCRFYFNESAGAQVAQRLDPAALARLRVLSEEAKKAFPEAGALRVADVLRWPGVTAEPPLDEEGLRIAAHDLCRRALDELVAARGREGAKLAASIGERVAAMRRRVDDVKPLVPQAIVAYQAKLAERLKEALGSADDERIRTEIAVFAGKSDVDEELERLTVHLAEVDRVLKHGGAAGKRLDFIAQELNREANTLASKAASAPIADCALELKLLIEQVREQVQNIE
ncbi:MAG TPA: YicC/YloC family endoribonuclease [Burkholderiales bacterium]|nr:YicC/YloC family endoribonuclease [Burkholderiales bacterium]